MKKFILMGPEPSLYGNKPYAELSQTPLAREIFVASLWIFGDSPWGARVFSAIAGALSLVFVYGIGKQFTQNTKLGIFAAGFLLFDPLFYVQARIGMPDMVLTCLILISFFYFSKIIHSTECKKTDYLLLGIFTGLAIAIKSVATVVVPIYLFGFFFSPPLSKGDAGGFKNRKSLLTSLYKREGTLNALIFLLPIPLLFWLPYVILGYSFVEMKEHLSWLWEFLRNFKSDPSIVSYWYNWLIGEYPLWYLNKEIGADQFLVVLLIGNLVFWVAAEIVFVALLFCWKKLDKKIFYLHAVILAQILFWAIKPATHLYYVLPILPFYALLIAIFFDFLFKQFPDKKKYLIFDAGILITLTALFFFYYSPLIVGKTVSEKALESYSNLPE